MLTTALFLGFPVDSVFASHLAAINPEIIRLFFQKEEGYLTEIIYLNQTYIGKFIEGSTNVLQLELLETHIYSVLKKIIPSYPYQKKSLTLLPIVL